MTLYQRILDDDEDVPWHALEAGMRAIVHGGGTVTQMGNRFGLDDDEKAELAVLMAPADTELSIAIISLVKHGQMTPQEGRDYFGV